MAKRSKLDHPVTLKHLLLALAVTVAVYCAVALYEDHQAISGLAEHVGGLEEVVKALIVGIQR